MSTHFLNRVFRPETVAWIGSGIKETSVGRTVMRNLASGGFEGRILHVKYGTGSEGDDGSRFAGVHKLPDHIDLVVIATPIETVPDILDICAQKKAAGAVIVSARDEKFKVKDREIIDRIRQISKQEKMRVIGPDSVGIVNSVFGLNASFMHGMPNRGRVVFLSQSGAVCTSVLDMAMRENVGFSHIVSLGSMLDVNFADLIDYFGSMDEVDSIIMVVEELSGMRNFMSAARAVSRVKPIIAMKTGSAGSVEDPDEDMLYDAAFKRAGILRVHEFGALFDCAEFLAKQKRPKGANLAIISNARGLSLMARDALRQKGLKPGVFSEGTKEKLEALLGAHWTKTNPIDLIRPSAASRKRYIETVKLCMDAPEIDGLLLLNSPLGTDDVTSLARELAALLNVSSTPVLTAWLGGRDIDKARNVFNRAGIVTYETPERAVRAFLNLYQFGRNLQMLQQIPVRTNKRLEIDYETAQQVIDEGLGKSEALSDALAQKLAQAYGIPVGSQGGDSRSDYDLFVSAVRHHDFGPVIRFGMGGTMTPIFDDAAMALPPLNRQLARTTIEETKISRLFKGHGHIKPISMESLEELLIRISRLITDFSQIQQVDINPIRVRDGKMTVTKGRVVLNDRLDPGQGRLIISPYPYWQETIIRAKNGEYIFIRPVRPSDAQQMIDLFDELSPETVYLRFFSPIKEISRPMLIRMTQIDYDREIALIAFSGEPGKRKIVGVSRIIFMPDGNQAEFAIVLADKWHGQGIGIQHLYHALYCAGQYGIETVWGPVISTNAGMLKMGQKLGFSVRHDMDSGEYKLIISLDTLKPLSQIMETPKA